MTIFCQGESDMWALLKRLSGARGPIDEHHMATERMTDAVVDLKFLACRTSALANGRSIMGFGGEHEYVIIQKPVSAGLGQYVAASTM